MSSLDYRSEIDGLRAVAVISVVFYHAGFSGFSGGYIGVDVFFVISGYLITSIIFNDLSNDNFNLISFFERRFRRIFPALLFVSLVFVPIAWTLMIPYQFRDFLLSVVSSLIFISNILFWRQTDYFADQASEIPLLHTWSLSVEGWFYIFYPLFVLIVWRFRHKWLLVAVALAALVSFTLAEWTSHIAPVANFFLVPTRAWELLAGGLVALGENEISKVSRQTRELLALAGVAMIAFAVVRFDEMTPFPSHYTLIPAVGASLAIKFGRPDTFIGKLLRIKSLVRIGLLSYSLYLWHYPTFVFANLSGLEWQNTATVWCLIFSSLACSYLSWRFIEKPFRRRNIVSGRLVARISVIGLSACLVLAATGFSTNGFEAIYKERFGEQAASILKALDSRGPKHIFEDDICRFWSDTVDEQFLQRFEKCAARNQSAVVVVGDSHAADLFNALYQAADFPFMVGLLKAGCRVDVQEAGCTYQDVADFVSQRHESITRVFFTQKGSYLLKWSGRNYELLVDSIAQTERYLIGLSAHVPVLWFGPQPEPMVDLRRINPVTGWQPAPDGRLKQAIDHLDNFLSRRLMSKSSISYFSKLDAIAYDHNRDFIIDGNYTYSDTNHWSTFGERVFGERIVKYLHNYPNITQNEDF